MKLSDDVVAQLQSSGVALKEVTGGVRKNRYFTPDGREVWAVPSIRNFIRKKDGKVIGGGTRDANLDNGWLLQPPTEPKLRCFHCDKWHDTKKEVDACGAARKASADMWQKRAQAMKRKEGGGEIDEVKADVSELKSDMSDIKKMLAQLLEKR